MDATERKIQTLATRIEALLWEVSNQAITIAEDAGNLRLLEDIDRGRSDISSAAREAAKALVLGPAYGTAEEREFALSTPYTNLHAALGCKSVGHVAKAIVREFDK